MNTPTATAKAWTLRTRLVLTISVGLVVMICVTSVYSRLKESQGRANLVQARSLLERLVFEPTGRQWTATADRAEQQLRSTIGTSSERPANLLLAGLSRIRPIRAIRKEHPLDPHSCGTADLAVASLLFFKGGDLGVADQLAILALDRPDERSRALKAATIIAYQLGRDEDVDRCANEWSQLEPGEVLPWKYLAYVAEDRGFPSNAITALRNEIQRTAGSTDEPRRRLILHLLKVGESTEARNEFSNLQSNASGSADEDRLLEARLLFLEGKLDDAEQLLNRAVFAAEDQIEAKILTGQLLMERSEFARAAKELRDCVARAPANQDAHYLLGQALARTGERAEAQKHLETHRQLLNLKVRINGLERQAGHQHDNVEVRLTLAELYRQIGLPEQAQLWTDAARAAQASKSR